MPTTALFPLPEGLEMTSISDTAEELLVRVTSHRANSPCPQCSMPSSAIHSSYHRHPRDLPCIGRPFACCSRSTSSFVAPLTARAKCSQNGSQISLKPPLI